MADFTSDIVFAPSTRQHESTVRETRFDIDFLDGALTDLETVDTHNLVTIPQDNALVSGYLIVTETFTSGGSATVNFEINGDDITGAIPVANLVVGDVVNFTMTGNNGTTSVSGYADSADKTLDVIIGTAALTAGAIELHLGVIENVGS